MAATTEERALKLAKKNWDLLLVGLSAHAFCGAIALDRPAREAIAVFCVFAFWGVVAMARRVE